MIIFNGELPQNCKKYILKKNATIMFFAALPPIIILGIIVALAYIRFKYFTFWLCVLCELTLVGALIFVSLSTYIYKEKTLENQTPKNITISENGNIEIELSKFFVYKYIDDIKRIIDCGEWYYMIFKFPKPCNIVVSKKLLIEGHIKDFEKLFDGKIRHKF